MYQAVAATAASKPAIAPFAWDSATAPWSFGAATANRPRARPGGDERHVRGRDALEAAVSTSANRLERVPGALPSAQSGSSRRWPEEQGETRARVREAEDQVREERSLRRPKCRGDCADRQQTARAVGETKEEKRKDREGGSPDRELPIADYQHLTVPSMVPNRSTSRSRRAGRARNSLQVSASRARGCRARLRRSRRGRATAGAGCAR